jgi:thiamine-monophosphate kinase
MKLSEIGEEALIERLVREHHLPVSGEGLVVGVGDDAAVLSVEGQDELLIVTTDMLIEGVHFRLDWIAPRELGWRAVAANISDVAAMGGIPTWTFVSIGLKPDTEISFVDALYDGMTEFARRFGSEVVGGDTNSARSETVISVTQMGRIEPETVTLRSTARVGDRILVTGHLGDSRGGLELLLKHGSDEARRISRRLVSAHLTPIPRLAESRAAVGTGRVRAMMDLSDGLGADLPKLCKASGVGAVVHADKLPISDDLRRAAELLAMSAVELAASGGEDFELLMAVAPENVERVRKIVEARYDLPVTEIGEFIEGSVEIAHPDGSRKPLSGGWEHFGQGAGC